MLRAWRKGDRLPTKSFDGVVQVAGVTLRTSKSFSRAGKRMASQAK